MIVIVAVLIGMVPLIPAVIYFFRQRKNSLEAATNRLLVGLNGFNVVVGLLAAGLGIIWLASPSSVHAAGVAAEAAGTDPYVTLAAALSTGLACIGAGIGISSTGAAAVGAIAEKPESFGRALIFVGLCEGIAIYGLIISFMLLSR
jgi:V/A-type H+/Na+-transporting ATPase subunit K